MNYNCTEFRKVQIFRCQLLVYELFHTIFFVIIILCYFFLDLKSPALWSLAVCMVVVGGGSYGWIGTRVCMLGKELSLKPRWSHRPVIALRTHLVTVF